MLENKKIIYISKNGETYFSPKNIIPGNCQVFKHIGNSKNSEIFLLRLPLKLNKKDHNDLFAYKNICPHQKISLDLKPGNFFNYDKTAIQCSTHGALFRIDDGFCFKGPCSGKLLEKLTSRLKMTK